MLGHFSTPPYGEGQLIDRNILWFLIALLFSATLVVGCACCCLRIRSARTKDKNRARPVLPPSTPPIFRDEFISISAHENSVSSSYSHSHPIKQKCCNRLRPDVESLSVGKILEHKKVIATHSAADLYQRSYNSLL